MLASVLNSPVAVKASVQVVRAFLWLRQALANHASLRRRVEDHEERLSGHDTEIRRLYEALQEYSAFEGATKPRIGFKPPPLTREFPSRFGRGCRGVKGPKV